MSPNARVALVAIALAGAALFLQTRTRQDVLPPGPALSSLPLQFAGWQGADLPFAPQTLAMLGPGEFLQRQYWLPEDGSHVDVYLAHRPNQHALASHVPTDCLLGSGWSVTDSGTAAFSIPGQPGFTTNRYVVTKDGERQLVLFWFWAHGRGVANLNRADFYLTLDSLRLNRSDSVLIRINTPLRAGETTDAAQQRLLAFAGQWNRLLGNFWR
jgi:EpsI family protein